jgi:hypothetical protein
MASLWSCNNARRLKLSSEKVARFGEPTIGIQAL